MAQLDDGHAADRVRDGAFAAVRPLQERRQRRLVGCNVPGMEIKMI